MLSAEHWTTPANLHISTLPSTYDTLTSGSTINLEWQSEGVSFRPSSQSAFPVEVNPCQSAVSLSAVKSSETRLVSYFTYSHHRVIDFSFSECEMHSLSFIPERRQLPEAWWRHQLNVICLRTLHLFGSPWIESLLFVCTLIKDFLIADEFASKCKWVQSNNNHLVVVSSSLVFLSFLLIFTPGRGELGGQITVLGN